MSQQHLRRVVWNDTLEIWQLLDVFIAEPLDFEMQVHVVGALAQPQLLVLCTHKRQTCAGCEEVDPEGGRKSRHHVAFDGQQSRGFGP